jgi:hypothetical protein
LCAPPAACSVAPVSAKAGIKGIVQALRRFTAASVVACWGSSAAESHAIRHEIAGHLAPHPHIFARRLSVWNRPPTIRCGCTSTRLRFMTAQPGSTQWVCDTVTKKKKKGRCDAELKILLRWYKHSGRIDWASSHEGCCGMDELLEARSSLQRREAVAERRNCRLPPFGGVCDALPMGLPSGCRCDRSVQECVHLPFASASRRCTGPAPLLSVNVWSASNGSVRALACRWQTEFLTRNPCVLDGHGLPFAVLQHVQYTVQGLKFMPALLICCRLVCCRWLFRLSGVRQGAVFVSLESTAFLCCGSPTLRRMMAL